MYYFFINFATKKNISNCYEYLELIKKTLNNKIKNNKIIII